MRVIDYILNDLSMHTVHPFHNEVQAFIDPIQLIPNDRTHPTIFLFFSLIR